MQSLQSIAKQLVAKGKGILAADESEKTLAKKFVRFGIAPTEQNVQDWRELLFTTPGIEAHISGVILHESTVQQVIDGISVPEYLQRRGILSGVKVDQGLGEFVSPIGGVSSIEKVTNGIERLDSILPGYQRLGCVFAKWRAVFRITNILPSELCIQANARLLVLYASKCQSYGLVPIVEPEVLMDGDHTIERCAEVTTHVLSVVFAKLKEAGVDLSGMLLKPNMVIGSKGQEDREIAEKTLGVLQKTVPGAVPGIVFLSGGQSADEATDRLGMIVHLAHAQSVSPAVSRCPWELSFSFGRALEDEACEVWAGKPEQVGRAQEVFAHRARLVAMARGEEYVL